MDKINILEGDWKPGYYSSPAFKLFSQIDINVVKQEIIDIMHLHNDGYWLRSKPNTVIGVVDYRHWYCSNDIFSYYVSRIVSAGYKYICMFESPLGYERPRNVNDDIFEKTLHERSRFIYEQIKTRSPSTKIISPAIRVMDDSSLERMYLNYFYDNSDLFDVYAVHCCTHMDDRSLGILTSFVNQVLNASFKPVWITKWAIPACDHKISSSKLVMATHWKPVHSSIAVAGYAKTYNVINDVAKGQTKWFFIGTGQDYYHPDKNVPVYCWQTDSLYRSDYSSNVWGSEHFIGAVDYKGNIKERMVNGFVEIYKQVMSK